jgi:hypothetical protein
MIGGSLSIVFHAKIHIKFILFRRRKLIFFNVWIYVSVINADITRKFTMLCKYVEKKGEIYLC